MIELLLVADRHLATGDLDGAERIYRQVADADPRNAMAVVGLARVAEARGSPEVAVHLAELALAIDPDDVAARRLRDVLRTTPPAGHRPVGRSLLARLRALIGLG